MAVPKKATGSPVTHAYKAIKLRKQFPAEALAIEAQLKLHPVTSRVLSARGFRAGEELERFITPTLREGLPGPEKLKGLPAACNLVKDTLAAGGGIAICCDFDVDGLSGGSQIYHFLRSIGARAQVYVPDRFKDGYGLNERMIEEIAKEKFSLVITVDYGTTNVKELTLARKLGLKTLVIDHHHVSSVPPADVFINPNQPGCGFAGGILCAAGLAWYFVLGLRSTLPQAKDIDAKTYLDLACLGTICDMVPLLGPNRVLAKRGLELLSKTERIGLRAIKQAMSLHGEVECSHVSFGIGPRINAAGRMVHGEVVIDLLTTSDTDKAKKIADRLNKLNLERQDEEERVKGDAIRMVEGRSELPFGIVVWSEDFHTGVVGLVAQRLVDTFYRPAVVLGTDAPGVFKGSVRGVKGFNVVESLAACGETLMKYGGHEGAGGLTVAEDRVEEFAAVFEQVCSEKLSGGDLKPYVEADTEISLNDMTVQLVNDLSKFAPFGMGNPSPQLLLKNLKVTETRVLKATHLKATLSDGKRSTSAILWRNPKHPALEVGKTVNIVCKPDLSTYQGATEVYANLQAAEVVR